MPIAKRLSTLGLLLAMTLVPVAAQARINVACPAKEPFETWLEGAKQQAIASGVRPGTASSALAGLTPDPSVLSHDRGQGAFRQSFESFYGKHVSGYALKKGASLLQRYANIFSKIEQQFGVPGPIIVAIWGLETGYGANSGNYPTIRALATLAYDCRRSEYFMKELIAALRLVDSGYLSAREMRGAWAGEIGQTQFMPSSYVKFAFDYEGNGKVDMIHSVPDVLASTANYLAGYGWRKGEPWGEGTHNFQVLLQWNKSTVYTRTVATMASKLAKSE